MALWILLNHKDSSPFLTHLDKTDEILPYLRKKKVALELINYSEDISLILKDPEAVLLIPTELLPEHTATIRFCNKHCVPVFVIASSNQLPDCHYSSLGGDTQNTVAVIVSYLNQHKRTKMAYFGASTRNTDISKISEFYSLLSDFNEDDVYFRFKSLDDCFDEFFEKRDKYESIICPNDMTAIYLIERLKETDPDYIKRTFIISYMNSILSQVYHTPITSTSYDSKYINHAIITMYRSLAKSREYAQTVSMTLRMFLHPRLTTNNLPCNTNEYGAALDNLGTRIFPIPKKMSSDFYDPIVHVLLSIERMLASSGNMDLKMILLFLQNKNQQEVAQELFIAIQTVRYRSGIIFKKVGVKNKKAFVSLLSKYISTENLEKYIQNKLKK